MQHRLIDIVDIAALRSLFEGFTEATGMVTAILDIEGHVLVATGWRDICTKFHRANPDTATRCLESDTHLANHMEAGREYSVYRCRNGLVDVAVPIVVSGDHLANLYTGQFFFSPPDKEYFEKQATEFGFDAEAYLSDLSRVPVFTEQQIEKTMAFLKNMARVIAEMGASRLRIDEELAERKRAEQELRRNERQKRLIIETVPDLVWLKDIEGKYLACNKMFERLFGEVEKNIIGKTDYDFVDKELADFFRKHDKAAMNAGRPLKNEEWITFADDGRTVLLETSKVALKDSGGTTIGVLGIGRDVTERHRAEIRLREAKEQAEFANRSKTEFLANMSHELRTPLTIINGAFDIISMEMFGPIDHPKYMEYAKDAREAGEHLLGIINDLLDVSMIEMDRLVLNDEILEVAEVLSFCHTLVKGRADTVGLALGMEIDDGLPRLRGDKLRIKQVLLNLLSNALKFTPSGGRVTLAAGTDSTGGVVLSVADTGIGIAGEKIVKALNSLGETGSPYVREVQGAGIGLALSRKLVELHGGILELDSDVGIGTTVTVRFPRERAVHLNNQFAE